VEWRRESSIFRVRQPPDDVIARKGGKRRIFGASVGLFGCVDEIPEVDEGWRFFGGLKSGWSRYNISFLA
jgi:hypothetical protein